MNTLCIGVCQGGGGWKGVSNIGNSFNPVYVNERQHMSGILTLVVGA